MGTIISTMDEPRSNIHDHHETPSNNINNDNTEALASNDNNINDEEKEPRNNSNDNDEQGSTISDKNNITTRNTIRTNNNNDATEVIANIDNEVTAANRIDNDKGPISDKNNITPNTTSNNNDASTEVVTNNDNEVTDANNKVTNNANNEEVTAAAAVADDHVIVVVVKKKKGRVTAATKVTNANNKVTAAIVKKKKKNGRKCPNLSYQVIEHIISFIIERSTLTTTKTKTTTTTTNTNSVSSSSDNTVAVGTTTSNNNNNNSEAAAGRNTTSNNINNNNNNTIDSIYVPKRGTFKLASIQFNTTQQNITKIWKRTIRNNQCNPNINDYIINKLQRNKVNPRYQSTWHASSNSINDNNNNEAPSRSNNNNTNMDDDGEPCSNDSDVGQTIVNDNDATPSSTSNNNNNNNHNDDNEVANNNNNDNDEVANNDVVAIVDDDVIVENNNKEKRRRTRPNLSNLEMEQIISFIIERSTLTKTTMTTTSNSVDSATDGNTSRYMKSYAAAACTTISNMNKTISLYVPKCGTLKLAGITFHTSTQNVSRLWQRAIINKCNPNINNYIVKRKSQRKKGNYHGFQPKWDHIELLNEIKNIPYKLRNTIPSLSIALGNIPTSTLTKLLNDGFIRCYCINNDTTTVGTTTAAYSSSDNNNNDNSINDDNALLPELNENDMLHRIYYCCSRIYERNDNNNTIKQLYYDDRYNEIHIDVKWFCMTKMNKEKYYLTIDEPDPLPSTKKRSQQQHEDHNHSIWYDKNKVMFLVAVARPLFDNDGNCIFDGKIGMWPFIVEQQEQHQHRFVSIKDVTVDIYLDYIKHKVIPAIKQYYPCNNRKQNQIDSSTMKIYIQYDNDTSPIPNLNLKTNPKWIEFCHNEETNNNQYSFIIKEQPLNSIDVNVCQLSFIPIIQSLQYKRNANQSRNVTSFIRYVMSSWNIYNPILLSNAWYKHSVILNCILNNNGNNKYNNSPKQQQTELLPPKVVYVNDGAIETINRFQLLHSIQSGMFRS